MAEHGADMERAERLNLALSAGAVAASFALGSVTFAVSVAAGAALEAINFRAMLRSGRAFFAGQLGSWTAGWAARLALVVVGMVAALYFGAHPVGLVIGLSLIMPAAIIEAWRSRPRVVEDAPALPPDDPSWDRWNPWLAREVEDDDDEDQP